jgi:hypothetical protein
MKPATELALVVAPPCPDLPGGGYGEGVVVTSGDGAHRRREGGHGRGHVGVGSRRWLAHRAVAVVPEPEHGASARGPVPSAGAGKRGEGAPQSEGARAGKEKRTHCARDRSWERRWYVGWAKLYTRAENMAQSVNGPFGLNRPRLASSAFHHSRQTLGSLKGKVNHGSFIFCSKNPPSRL